MEVYQYRKYDSQDEVTWMLCKKKMSVWHNTDIWYLCNTFTAQIPIFMITWAISENRIELNLSIFSK